MSAVQIFNAAGAIKFTRAHLYIAGGALAVLYLLTRQGVAGGIAASLAGAAVDAVGGAASGAVLTVGDQFGVPRTDDDKCTLDLAAGRTWDASFSCPAPRFSRAVIWGDERAEALKKINQQRESN